MAQTQGQCQIGRLVSQILSADNQIDPGHFNFFAKDCYNPPASTMRYSNLLHWSCVFGMIDLITYILSETYLDPSQTDCKGYSAIWLAADFNQICAAELILKNHRINPNLQITVRVNLVLYTGHTGQLIHWCAAQGHVNGLRLLLTYPTIAANIIDDAGRPPIYYAYEWAQHECLALLLADDRVNFTYLLSVYISQLFYPLHDAAQKGFRVLLVDGRFSCAHRSTTYLTV
jgi:ankyrin repeat protein